MKECEILGYGTYVDKETQENMFRIVIAYDPKKEKYFGLQPAPAFLNFDSQLETQLNLYLKNKNNYKAYYETTGDIGSKTQVSKIIIEEN